MHGNANGTCAEKDVMSGRPAVINCFCRGHVDTFCVIHIPFQLAHTVQSLIALMPHAQYLFHPSTSPGLPAPSLLAQDYLLYHILDVNADAATGVCGLVVVTAVGIGARVTD